MRRLAFAGALVFLAACRGGGEVSSEDRALQKTIDSLVPFIEQATGLNFKRHPRGRMIDRAEASAYIADQIERQLAGGRGEDIAAAYKLLGLIPDSIDLKSLYQGVFSEQVAGFYDPERDTFFGVRGNPTSMRLLVSHELVHALQHDYVPLDSLMHALDNSDRSLATLSVLEGQAMLASTRLDPKAGDRVLGDEFWEAAQAAADQQVGSMPRIAAAPRIVRDGVTFPYLQGGAFVAWWMRNHPAGEMPYGSQLPTSSEEILAPARSAAGDRTLEVTFVDGPAPRYSDVLGAAGLRILYAAARGIPGLVDPVFLGWGGDRFTLYDTPDGGALVWILVFDSRAARDNGAQTLSKWPPARAGYRTAVEKLDVSGKAALRITIAPTGWSQWNSLPTATAVPLP